MKVLRIALVGLAALSILAPSANAQQTLQQRFPWMFQGQKKPEQKLSTTVALVRKFQPVIRSYPGVSADILGIRTGMTVSQVESIAAKAYQAQPMEYKARGFFKYKEISVQSQPFVPIVLYSNQKAETYDNISLFFNTPVTGNTLHAMARDVEFGAIGNVPRDPASAPLISTLEASLLRKYGPPSYRNVQPDLGYYIFSWTFPQAAQSSCGPGGCADAGPAALNPLSSGTTSGVGSLDLNSYDLNSHNLYTLGLHKSNVATLCGPGEAPHMFRIYARIEPYSSDRTKAEELDVSIWDPSTCGNDIGEAVKQMNAAAIKFYNSVSKAPAAPKL